MPKVVNPIEKQNFVFFSKKVNLLEIPNPVPRGGFLYLNFNPVKKNPKFINPSPPIEESMRECSP